MIFRGGGGEGGDDIYNTQGRKGREDIGKSAYYMYLSIVSITLSKEVSLESIFLTLPVPYIYFRPADRAANTSFNTKFQLAAIFNHPK